MAVVEFSRKDFESLVGRKLSDSDLTEKITMMGFPLEKMEGDRIFYEVFPNRPDMLSVEGFARSVRHFLGIEKAGRKYALAPSGIKLAVDRSVSDVRPFIAAAVIEKVRFSDDFIASLMQVQEKLHETLGRKRKKVAIGVHDLDKIKPPFTYRAAEPSEVSFVPLDMTRKMSMDEILKEHEKGRKYAHILSGHRKYPVVLDRNGDVVSFPPIINADMTRVTENTHRLLIEITGTSSQAVSHALNIIATALIERGCVAKTVEITGYCRARTPDLSPRSMSVSSEYVSRMLGIKLTSRDFSGLLERMGMWYSRSAMIPAYRTDIMHPMDIAEEIAIAYGYQCFKPEIPLISTIASPLRMNSLVDAVHETLIGMGCQEVVGMILTNEADEFSRMNRTETEHCMTSNPTTEECTMTRKSVMPSLMRIFSQNKNREYPQKIFETGYVVVPDKSCETGACNVHGLACAFSDIEAAYEDASIILDSLMRNLGMEYSLKKASHSSFIEGRCAEVVVKGKTVGVIGELSPPVLENWKIEKPVSGFEIDLSTLSRCSEK